MRTAYCPKSHRELASESSGKEYGHVPGHQYHDVDVVVSQRGTYRVHVVESWGSAQGYDEEHGRKEVIGRAATLQEALRNARQYALDAGMHKSYLTQALSQAEDAAVESEATTEEPVLDYFVCVGSVRGECGHKHATYAAAQRCNERDQTGCASQGGYSDRVILAVDSDGSRRPVADDEIDN